MSAQFGVSGSRERRSVSRLDDLVEAALRESIRCFGVLAPVHLDQFGNVLDGHTRIRIADELGVPYDRVIVQIRDDVEAKAIAFSLNVDRRVIPPQDRKRVAIELRKAGHSLRAIGGALSVSKSQVALDVVELSSSGQLPAQVLGLDGKRRPSRPTKVLARNDREQVRAQEALVRLDCDAPSRTLLVHGAEELARKAEVDRRRAGVPRTTTLGSVEVHVADAAELLASLRGASADLILIDPEYDDQVIASLDTIAKLASKVLKKTGTLAVMVGVTQLPDVLQVVSEHLTYRWVIPVIASGAAPQMFRARVFGHWKAIALFRRKDGRISGWIANDVVISPARSKEHHPWEQNVEVMAALVEQLSPESGFVVDPMCGSGSALIAAQRLGRRAIGGDIDPGAVRTTRERLREIRLA
jgi:ParB-like chromosome segregation protein Spo0J